VESKSKEIARSKRTLVPESEPFTSYQPTPSLKVNYNPRVKSTAQGSIGNLLLSTPTYYEIYNKQQQQNWSKPDLERKEPKPPQRGRSSANLIRIRKDQSFAGMSSDKKTYGINLEMSPSLSYSRSKKLLNLSSDIFNTSYHSVNNSRALENQVVPAFADRINVPASVNLQSLSYTVDITDNTRKKVNINPYSSKTRNNNKLEQPISMLSKYNSKGMTKNQSKDTLYKTNASFAKY